MVKALDKKLQYTGDYGERERIDFFQGKVRAPVSYPTQKP